MKAFVPYEKLSKKAKRALDLEKRRTWGFSPVTRSPMRSSAYNRKKTRRMDLDDPPDVSFFRQNGYADLSAGKPTRGGRTAAGRQPGGAV